MEVATAEKSSSMFARRPGEDRNNTPFMRPADMPTVRLAAPNVNIPRSGSHTLDPGQRAARTRQFNPKRQVPARIPTNSGRPWNFWSDLNAKRAEVFGRAWNV
jgi:hypothetical protein